jgi:arylsulfatase A-like enzyme
LVEQLNHDFHAIFKKNRVKVTMVKISRRWRLMPITGINRSVIDDERSEHCLYLPFLLYALKFLLVISCHAIWTSAVLEAAEDTTSQRSRPNVLFLFADDQRADTIAALGNPVVKTPTLDRLVRRGYSFRNAYCLGSHSPAVCSPSRNMLLSGQAYFRWRGPQAPADGPNWPTAMNQAGYQTYHHGKNGNTAQAIQKKFEINRYLRNDEAERLSGEPGAEIVDAAIAFLNDRSTDRPFCMYLAFGNPHDPRVAARHYLDLYDRSQIPVPKNFLPLHPFDNGEQLVRDERLAPWPRTKEEIQKQLHEYYAVITAMDGHIGRLLKTLEQRGLLEKTLVIYSSDHGLAMGSHGLMGKQNLYEHSMKSPLIFAGPGIPQGETQALAYLLDIFPTICDLTDVPVPAGIDGRSLKPVIMGNVPKTRETIGCAYRDVQRSIRDDRWKLIQYPQINRTQLFDLQSDPDELFDLSTHPNEAPRVAGMLKTLEVWQREFGDTLPLTSKTPKDAHWMPPQ